MSIEIPSKRLSTVTRGFREFIRDYGVIPLAVGVVIGTAVNDFVKSLVDGLITPLVALMTPEGKLQNLSVTLHGATFKFGQVLNSLISLIIVAAVVYWIAKYVLRDEKILKKK